MKQLQLMSIRMDTFDLQDLNFCHLHVKNKQYNVKFLEGVVQRHIQLLDLVHFNIYNSIQVANHFGSTYFITFIDDL